MTLATGDRLLTTKQAVDLLHVAESTLWRWRQQGLLTVLRTPSGRYVRYRESDVLRLMQEDPTKP